MNLKLFRNNILTVFVAEVESLRLAESPTAASGVAESTARAASGVAESTARAITLGQAAFI